mmetsp:Transcript_9144/g.9925  ORF Transcript_9144/g.9925 Transcript_9144/m.9925 type:complete len:324 (+) Transcript_9144:42-1013(+)
MDSAEFKEQLLEEFKKQVKSDPNASESDIAIRMMSSVIDKSSERTVQGLSLELKETKEILIAATRSDKSLANLNLLSFQAACEIFLVHVNRQFRRFQSSRMEFDKLRTNLQETASNLAYGSLERRDAIEKQALRFMRDGIRVLVHGYSPLIESILITASEEKSLNVTAYVTESRPNNEISHLCESLSKAGIETFMIPDNAIAYIMESIDIVVVDSEAVVENGGIINTVGTLAVAICAKNFSKPFYVVTESFKFARLFPLTQGDLKAYRKDYDQDEDFPKSEEFKLELPTSDYTPPEYITLLFTDLGTLTPSAVSDELIQLFTN